MIWDGKQRVEVSLSDEQIRAIISAFRQKPCYASFIKYVEAVKADPNSHAPIDGFEEELVRSTNDVAGHGPVLWYYIWEELLKEHGLNVSWSQ